MLWKLKLFIATFALQMFGTQCKLNYDIEDFELEYVNPEYFDANKFDVSINYKEGSKNTLRVNVKVIKDLPQDLKVKFQFLGGVFGHYKVPIYSQDNLELCSDATYDYFFVDILSPIGLSKDNCPAKKGDYVVQEYFPDINSVPDVPKGLMHSNVLLILDIYSAVGQILKFKVFVKI